ncbi:MAG: hydroxymethylbilane synthase [Pseudomonadota bacterium]|nr:hydroxymethylbilane synthase [Pseudomonadota bacterium]
MAATLSLLRIATRESPLALAQTRLVADALRAAIPGLAVEWVPMTTRGDRVLDRPLAQVGGKALFVKELEVALDEGRADIAVHSLKDVPMVIPPQFALATFGAREVPLDAFVSSRYPSLAALPPRARVGTSSLRRECQLRRAFPELDFRALRGNVNTRLAKLDAGEYDAIILAAAGLRRLGLEARIRATLPDAIPAIGQGVLAVEYLGRATELAQLLAPFEDRDTACAARAERALGLVVEGSCDVPLGAYSQVTGARMSLDAFVGLPDGSRFVRCQAQGDADHPEALGAALGEQLLATGGREILALLAAPARGDRVA